ncbi:MAG: DUF1761 domain-containing protein [Sphingopyxis sp.]
MRVAGVNILAVLAAAVAIYLIGFLIYGMIVDPAVWMASSGITQAEMDAVGTSRMPYGVVMPLMTAGFMAVLFNWANVSGLVSGVKWGALIAFASAIPTVLYGWVYGVGDCTGPMIDSAHLLIGHVVAGGILASWK